MVALKMLKTGSRRQTATTILQDAETGVQVEIHWQMPEGGFTSPNVGGRPNPDTDPDTVAATNSWALGDGGEA